MIDRSKNAIDFAICCYNDNTIKELQDSKVVDQIDCKTWNITADEWKWAIETALEAKIEGGSISDEGEIIYDV